jgi:cephalosporin hydroxylase
MELVNNSSNITLMATDEKLQRLKSQIFLDLAKYKYSYNFSWLGLPIIQFPQDMLAMQELIWKCKPDLIIETGIAHGGSLIFYASVLELIGNGMVLGVDIEIREYNRAAIERHSLAKKIRMIQGSSIDDDIFKVVSNYSKDRKNIMVILDSNHTYEHVLKELNLYAPLVTKGSYLVVFDTAIEDVPEEYFKDRLWGKNNNPKTAVWKFMDINDRFVIDKEIENKLLFTSAPDGYLKCVK